MKIYQFSKLLVIAMLSLLVIMPATAQEVTEVTEEFDTIEITFEGYISFDADGNVLIDGYFLAPAGAISPSLLSEGQYVSVTGVFLNDDTFQLTAIDTSVEEPVDCDVDGTTEDTADDCVEEPPVDEPTCDADGTTEDTADDCVEEEECTPDGHPVAARIADAFDVSPCEVEEMHDAGNGFGNIAKAYLLAEAANQAILDGLAEGEEVDPTLLTDPQAFIDMHSSGTGWGQIVQASGIHPSALAPGQLKNRGNSDDDTEETTDAETETETTTTGNNGNGNGNANANNGNANANNGNGNNGNGNSGNNGNGNNGNGNSGNNGNGNGNNGNGNSGNNGNGNGNGKGKGK